MSRTLEGSGNQVAEILINLKKDLTKYPKTLFDCVEWARLLFQENYHDSIRQLLHNFPPDNVTTQGTPFWSGTKRCPKPIIFDVNNVPLVVTVVPLVIRRYPH